MGYCQCLLSNPISKDSTRINKFNALDTLTTHLTSTVTVKVSPVERSAFNSFQENLKGEVAGLQIISQGGKICQDLNVFIRGKSTFSGKDEPLIIIDGHRVSNRVWEKSNGVFEPLNPLSFINQYDIESVEIIKDGLAGALYGLQAANGAIVITTKRGSSGKPYFTFNTEIGIAQPSNKLDLIDRSQYIEMFKDSYNNSRYSETGSPSWQQLLTAKFPYWQDSSSPNDLTKGPNTDWQKLIFRNSLLHNYNLAVTGGTAKLRYYSSLFWSNQKGHIIGSNSQNIAGQLNIDFKPIKWLTMRAGVSPTLTDYDRSLKPNFLASPMMAILISPLDPLYIPNTNKYNDPNRYNSSNINPVALQSVGESTLKNILIDVSVKADITKYLFFSIEVWRQQSRLKEKNSNEYVFDNFWEANSTITNYNYSLTFTKPIFDRHRVAITAGYYSNKENIDYNFPFRNHNFFLNASLNLYNKLFVNQIVRQDFSSILHHSKVSYYSSVAWQVLGFLSVNSSFGNIKSDYQEQFDWQTTKHFNLGLSFALLDKIISGEFNYFDKLTSNMYYQSPLPPTGSSNTFPTYSLKNSGIEVTLHSINLDRCVKWNTSVNITFLKNKITELEHSYVSGSHIFKEGLSAGVYNLAISAGVDPANGTALYYTNNDRDEITTSPQLAIPQVTGNSNPKFYGGIANTLTYNGFDLSFFWQFVCGNDIFSRGEAQLASTSNLYSPYNKTVEYYNNYWKNPGDIAKYPKPSLSNANDYTNSTLYLFDGSYLRLNDLTIGYTLQSHVASKFKIASARFFARGTNLLTITKFPGYAPDIYDTESLNAPQSRVISLGIQLGF